VEEVPAAAMAPAMAVLAAVIAPAMAGPAAATDRVAELARLAAETYVGKAVGDGRVLAVGTACPVVAGSAVAKLSLAVDGVWRRDCER
jgi:streptogramin lyase